MPARRAKNVAGGLAVGLLILSPWAAAQVSSSAPQAEEIRAVLKAQTAAWNARNIKGFMAYYWASEELTFQSGGNRIRGWQTMLDRYLKNYSGDQWGSLEFTDLEIRLLGPAAAYVLGRWKVDGTGKAGQGVFTLVLRKLPQGWRIIHDHTS
jgi:uncharacterized protein (TIGR02246 family)